jgi:hypothetical protein
MYLNSRYANGQVLVGKHGSSVVQTVSRTFPDIRDDYLVYRWKAGDRIDIVASGLGLPRLSWYKIMDANPEIPCPTMIQPGSVIRIPRT